MAAAFTSRTPVDPILKKIAFLVVLVVVAAGVLVGESYFERRWLSECHQRYENQHARRCLGQSMRIDLAHVEAAIQQLAADHDLRSIALLHDEILTLLGSVENALTVLSSGGVYNHVVCLNLEDRDTFEDTICYTRTKEDRIIIEAIELSPKIADLEANVARLVDKLREQIAAPDQASQTALRHAVTLCRKQTEATLVRARENVNKIFYDSSERLVTLGRENARIMDRTSTAQVATAGLMVFTCLIVGGVTLRHVVRILSERKAALAQLQEHHDQLDRLVGQRTAALEQLSRRYELILDSAGEGILGVDRDGNTTFVNPVAASMYGAEIDEIIGTSHHHLFHHTKADGTPYAEADCPIRKTIENGTPYRAVEDMYWRKDGTTFPVVYSSTPIFEKGELTGAVVTFQDVTERRAMEAQLTQAQKLESIGQLAAGIAHEINTPTQYVGDNTRFLRDSVQDLLRFVDKYVALLNHHEDGQDLTTKAAEIKEALEDLDIEYLNEEIPKAIEQSLQGVDRVATIVRSMKEFSHPGGSGKQPADLNKAIESTITMARNEWKYVAEMITDFDDALPLVPCLIGDFNQVVLNMIINAAHAIRDAIGDDIAQRGTITIRTRHTPGHAEVRITDTGVGMSPEVQARAFDPFFTTKEVGKGTGQGLALAHAVIVSKHGGQIDIQSEVDQGTTFTIRLPLEPETTETPDRTSVERG